MEYDCFLMVEGIKLLSLSYKEQRKALPPFVDIPDDVTSAFEDGFLMMPQLVERRRLTRAAIASILRLYFKEQWCIRNVGFDDFEHPEWEKVRSMAGETLKLLEEGSQPPS